MPTAPQVAFPVELDVYDFCTPELQAQLKGPRDALKDHQDRLAVISRTAKTMKTEDGPKPGPGAAAAAAAAAADGGAAAADNGAAAAGGDVEMRDAGAAAAAASEPASTSSPAAGAGALTGVLVAGSATPLRPPLPAPINHSAINHSIIAPNAGKYELIGVLTHKGRSADSGHYVAWVRQGDGSWVLFDDDELHMKQQEDVLALCGGGDWHMAYLLLYRAVRVPADAAAAAAGGVAAAEAPAAAAAGGDKPAAA
jgi:ubiquitin carboxyl-terminal hydrolase 14